MIFPRSYGKKYRSQKAQGFMEIKKGISLFERACAGGNGTDARLISACVSGRMYNNNNNNM